MSSETYRGLSEFEALRRLKKFGPNKIERGKSISRIKILLSQFENTLVILLILATAVSFLIGEEVSAIVIISTLTLNILLGFFEDFKAENEIKRLKETYKEEVSVIRDGKVKVINSEFIVPGDLVLLREGLKVPADGEVLDAEELLVNESSLTGESEPVYKNPSKDKSSKIILAGTFIISGKGIMRVDKTGANTEIGKIVESVEGLEAKKTPLQKELDNTGKILGSIIIILSIIIFLFILIKNNLLGETLSGMVSVEGQRIILNSLITAIALSVAAVPEGLPTIVTLALSFGSKKFLKNNIFVKRLSSVETLGSVDVICTDKTGTITEGKMRVIKFFFNGKVKELREKIPKQILKVLCLSTDINSKKNSPTEDVLIDLIESKKFHLKNKKIFEVPFTHERKFTMSLNKIGRKYFLSVKGAPEIILNNCDKILLNNKVVKLTKNLRKRIFEKLEETSNIGLRNIGLAYMETRKKIDKELPNKLIFVGFLSLEDKPRQGVKESILKCKNAGIKTVMITGDFKGTALFIAKEVGIVGESMSGDELSNLSVENLSRVINKYSIFYRVLPSHKLKILKALHIKKHVVAMTGDGVNDAPALKEADIGIAVNSGTDVAKNSADIILLDNNFKSIVKAVEEGRKIYSNIKKSVRYLLSSNLAEVALIFLAIMFGLPLPLIAVQILWMNLLTDSFPAFSLILEPPEKDLMQKNPRGVNEHLLNKKELGIISFLASVMSLFSLLIFTSNLPMVNYARTAAFTSIVFFELVNVINSKSETRPSIKSLFSNKILWISILVSLALQLSVIYIKPLEFLFVTKPLKIKTILMILSFSLLVILSGDIIKLYLRISKDKSNLSTLRRSLR